MAYISEKSDVYKPYLVTTKKEIRETLGIPERTLDKLLKVLKGFCCKVLNLLSNKVE